MYFFIRYKVTSITKRWDRTMSELEEHGHTVMVNKLVEARTFPDAVEVVREHENQIQRDDSRKELDGFEDLTLRALYE